MFLVMAGPTIQNGWRYQILSCEVSTIADPLRNIVGTYLPGVTATQTVAVYGFCGAPSNAEHS